MKEGQLSQWHNIFPGMLNDHNSLFGGKLMEWMDELAYISASRFTRKEMVTVSVENIKFMEPVMVGNIIEIQSRIIQPGNVKLKIGIDVYCENKFTGIRVKAIEAIFIFARIDENYRPVRIHENKKAV